MSCKFLDMQLSYDWTIHEHLSRCRVMYMLLIVIYEIGPPMIPYGHTHKMTVALGSN